MAEQLFKAVVFICPVCNYEIFIYFDDLQKHCAFDGKNFKSLPKIPCHICHRSHAEAKKIVEVPDCFCDPLDLWLDPH